MRRVLWDAMLRTATRAFLLAIVALGASTALARTPRPTPPETAKRPVTDSYHGVQIVDEYRWLEDAADQAVQVWSDAQNALTRAWLDARPARAALRERVRELYSYEAPSWTVHSRAGGKLFAVKRQPPREQSFIIALDSADDPASERVIFDPNTLDPSGKTAFDWFEPSRDGRYLAISISLNGSEDGTLAIYDVATGKALPDRIPRVQYGTAGGAVAWNADNTGVFYTRYPAPNERKPEDLHSYQEIWFHRLGTPVAKDTYAFGRDLPRIAEHALTTSQDGRWVLDAVQKGDGGDYELYLKNPKGKWQRIARYEDRAVQGKFGPDGALYVLSRDEAPRGKVLRVDPAAPDLDRADVVLPEGEAALQDLLITETKVVAVELVGGPRQLRVVDHDGQNSRLVPTLPVSTVGALVPLGGDAILYQNVSFLEPQAWWSWRPEDAAPKKSALASRSLASFADAEVRRVMVESKDGTQVPMSIILKKGTRLDGKNPTLLTGYGGYGISIGPSFSPFRRVWLDHGGVFAIANLRGGGEFGDEWHRDGNLTHKQNVFDDFAACAEWLVAKKVTRPARLAILGGSNGGLLMGAMITQHPKLVGAVVSSVGIYDMLRVELQPNGEFNTTEFGTVKDPRQFAALHAYSPFHHVTDGVEYPSVLFLTGKHDPRVDPSHSRKMTARLQASGTKRPILLRTSADTGHGMGTSLSRKIEEDTDALAFLFEELAIKPRRR
jgi:prolyl oligopeptidase